MKLPVVVILASVFFAACGPGERDAPEAHPNTFINTQESFPLFQPVETRYDAGTLVIPDDMTYDILFTAQTDSVVRADGKKFPAKESADFIAYIPIDGSSEHGYLYVNQETAMPDDNLGDGGGGTMIEIQKTEGRWNAVGDKKHIDFKPVGGTLRNCGGVFTAANTILTAEETEPRSNADLVKSYRDTSNFGGMKRYQHFGWMVEVDPFTGKALRKLYQMGRYEHEDAHIMPDNRTVYLTDDAGPCVLFKFVAKEANNFGEGQLYAYRQSEDGLTGDWITLPMHLDSLIDARNVAMRLGATIFIRHEWIDGHGDKLYITETGSDGFDFTQPVAMGAKTAQHLKDCCNVGGEKYEDPYGRVLELDVNTGKIRVLVEGGTMNLSPGNFSNPDGLAFANISDNPYLIINEDLIGTSKDRVGPKAKDEVYNEVYFLSLALEQPSLENLNRFLIAPKGAETTGSAFTPDGSTYFVSIQHPDADNPAPFNRTAVIAVQGFSK